MKKTLVSGKNNMTKISGKRNNLPLPKKEEKEGK